MHKQLNKITWTQPLYRGVDINEIMELVSSHVTQYKHGNINDLLLYAQKGYVEVPTKETCDFVHQWGKLKNLEGSMRFVRDESKTKISVENQMHIVHYECDSRQVFKKYRALEKLVKGTRKLTKRPENESSEYWLDDMVLMVALFISDDLEQLKMLEPYSTNAITKRMNSSQFKHWYKLVHPDTKYIKTQIPTKQ